MESKEVEYELYEFILLLIFNSVFLKFSFIFPLLYWKFLIPNKMYVESG